MTTCLHWRVQDTRGEVYRRKTCLDCGATDVLPRCPGTTIKGTRCRRYVYPCYAGCPSHNADLIPYLPPCGVCGLLIAVGEDCYESDDDPLEEHPVHLGCSGGCLHYRRLPYLVVSLSALKALSLVRWQQLPPAVPR